MSFGLEAFKQSEAGSGIANILGDHDNVIKMIALSEHDIPAVQAIGKQVEMLGHDFSDGDKQSIGRWIKEVMAGAGWETGQSGRVRAGNYFKTGAIYHKKKK